MTAMLASVKSLEEADIVVKAGVDILDLKDPNHGALGALEVELIKSIVDKYSDKITISATIGDKPFDIDLIKPSIDSIIETNVDIIKVGVFSNDFNQSLFESLIEYKKQNIKIVLVFFADKFFDYIEITKLLDSSVIYGVMLDTANKNSGSLLEITDIERLNEFVIMAKKNNLFTGLAGSLKSDDIKYLLPLQPDYLGFRGALCSDNDRVARLDELSVHRIKQQIFNTEVDFRQTI